MTKDKDRGSKEDLNEEVERDLLTGQAINACLKSDAMTEETDESQRQVRQ